MLKYVNHTNCKAKILLYKLIYMVKLLYFVCIEKGADMNRYNNGWSLCYLLAKKTMFMR